MFNWISYAFHEKTIDSHFSSTPVYVNENRYRVIYTSFNNSIMHGPKSNWHKNIFSNTFSTTSPQHTNRYCGSRLKIFKRNLFKNVFDVVFKTSIDLKYRFYLRQSKIRLTDWNSLYGFISLTARISFLQSECYIFRIVLTQDKNISSWKS